MADHKNSPPEVAQARIAMMRNVAKQLSVNTGGDPAECVMELICAAILISHEARPLVAPAKVIADIAPAAEKVVEEWFADVLKLLRCRHG